MKNKRLYIRWDVSFLENDFNVKERINIDEKTTKMTQMKFPLITDQKKRSERTVNQ